jgi:hypothetical protein
MISICVQYPTLADAFAPEFRTGNRQRFNAMLLAGNFQILPREVDPIGWTGTGVT